MSIIYMLLTVSVLVALVFFVAFIVSVKSGQFDDTYTPSIRMLFEDEIVKDVEITSEENSDKKPITTKKKHESLWK